VGLGESSLALSYIVRSAGLAVSGRCLGEPVRGVGPVADHLAQVEAEEHRHSEAALNKAGADPSVPCL
jgi:hypothetical protein